MTAAEHCRHCGLDHSTTPMKGAEKLVPMPPNYSPKDRFELLCRAYAVAEARVAEARAEAHSARSRVLLAEAAAIAAQAALDHVRDVIAIMRGDFEDFGR